MLGVAHVGAVLQASTQPEPGDRAANGHRPQQVKRSIDDRQVAITAERAQLPGRVGQLVAGWPEVAAEDARVAEDPAILEAEVGRAETALGVTGDPDRKSTRLNSSHLVI